jgi:membrane protein YqaA with SNARE-associated domain
MQDIFAFFQRLGEIVRPFAEQFGAPALILVAFLDASFLSIPEVCDVLVVTLTLQNPGRWWYFAASTTLGAVLGCYVLYQLGRKGGEAFVRRRLHERHIEWGMRMFRRYGLLAIIVPSLLPPPMPFKLFVLVAGIVDIRPRVFIAAVALGRGFRYGVEGWLARTYGDRAMEVIRDNLTTVSIAVAAALILFSIAVVIWRRTTLESSTGG